MPTGAEQSIQEAIEQEYKRAYRFGYISGFLMAICQQTFDHIHLCERLLNRPLTPQEELSRLTCAALTQRADELEALVLAR